MPVTIWALFVWLFISANSEHWRERQSLFKSQNLWGENTIRIIQPVIWRTKLLPAALILASSKLRMLLCSSCFFFSLEPKKVLPRLLLEGCLGREDTGVEKGGVNVLYHSCPQSLSPGSVKCLMAATVWEIFLEDLIPVSIFCSNYDDDDNDNSHDGTDYFEHPPWANQYTGSATYTVSNQYINPKRQTLSSDTKITQ